MNAIDFFPKFQSDRKLKIKRFFLKNMDLIFFMVYYYGDNTIKAILVSQIIFPKIQFQVLVK